MRASSHAGAALAACLVAVTSAFGVARVAEAVEVPQPKPQAVCDRSPRQVCDRSPRDIVMDSVSGGGVDGNAASGWAAALASSDDDVGSVYENWATAVQDLAGHLEERPAISADGRFVAFTSAADNLVPGDTNGLADVFLRDTHTGGTDRVSLGDDGSEPDGMSFGPVMSADGTQIAFVSLAENLVEPGAPACRSTRPAEAVTLTSRDPLYLAVTAGGRCLRVFVRDVPAARTILVSVDESGSPPAGHAQSPSISADGSRIAFEANFGYRTGLPLARTMLYVRDRDTDNDGAFDEDGATRTVLVYEPGERPNDPSEVFRPHGDPAEPVLSSDGVWIGYRVIVTTPTDDSADPGELGDVAVLQHVYGGAVHTVSVAPDGTSEVDAWPGLSLSADASRVAFVAKLLHVDGAEEKNVYVWDRSTGTSVLASALPTGGYGSGISESPSLSADGRWLTFASTNAMFESSPRGISQVYRSDLSSGSLIVETLTRGEFGSDDSIGNAISADGSCVAFASQATNLVADDRNGVADVFHRCLGDGPPELPHVTRPVPATTGGPHVVIAVVGARINTYHEFFRAPALTSHASNWLSGFPEGATSVPLSLGAGSVAAAVAADRQLWDGIEVSTYDEDADVFDDHLYTFPGTRIVGAVAFGARAEEPPILEPPMPRPDTALAGLAAGANLPRPEGDVLLAIVDVPLLQVEDGILWAARQPWIDAIVFPFEWLSNVSLSLGKLFGDRHEIEWATREADRSGKPVIVGSGWSYLVGPTCSTATNSVSGPPWVTRVGVAQVRSSNPDAWNCLPPDGLAQDAVLSPSPAGLSTATTYRGPLASASNAAGHFALALLRARRAGSEADPHTVMRHLLAGARPRGLTVQDDTAGLPAHWAQQGYGQVDIAAVDRATASLGTAPSPPSRPEDRLVRADRRARQVLWDEGLLEWFWNG